MNEQKPSAVLNIPTAIVIAGAIIAGSLIYVFHPASSSPSIATPGTAQTALKPVSADDHILGNPNAKIKIVEYSDPSCPYCKMFNTTMEQVMSTYGATGDVAWVYRNFPLDKPDSNGDILHPNAGHEAQALECAADLGGNDAFWKYEHLLYTTTPSVTPTTPNGLDQKQLPIMAKQIGLDEQSFTDCLSSGKDGTKIEQQYTDGVNLGITGTPTSFMVTPSGSVITIEGAQSFANLDQSIQAILSDPSANPTSSSTILPSTTSGN